MNIHRVIYSNFENHSKFWRTYLPYNNHVQPWYNVLYTSASWDNVLNANSTLYCYFKLCIKALVLIVQTVLKFDLKDKWYSFDWYCHYAERFESGALTCSIDNSSQLIVCTKIQLHFHEVKVPFALERVTQNCTEEHKRKYRSFIICNLYLVIGGKQGCTAQILTTGIFAIT